MQCFHMLRVSVPLAYSGKSLRSKVFHRAELLDGTRDSVLALNHMQSSTLAVLRAAPFLSILSILWFLNPHAVPRWRAAALPFRGAYA